MILAVGKRLVVEEIIPEPKKSPSGLIIPSQKEEVKAIVVAVGSEVDGNVDKGDIVILPHETGIEIKIEQKNYLSIIENQILAVIRGSNE